MMGDCRQIAPVVVKGTIPQIISAHMFTSPIWPKVEVFKFTKNLRLQGLEDGVDPQDNDAVQHLAKQIAFTDMLLKIGDGNSYDINVQLMQEDEETCTSTVRLPLIKIFSNEEEALQFLHPNGFHFATMHRRAILATTNASGDRWNTVIQRMNPEAVLHELLSADVFNEVDDVNGILRHMVDETVLNRFFKNGVPSHKLLLKKNDICLILRSYSKKEKIATNTRVRILKITTFCVQVETLTNNPQVVNLNRVRFQFRLPFGRSYSMVRTQFPLRLAYCMSYNKAQGQEYAKTLVDITSQAFSHGHAYVACSRVRDVNDIAFFAPDEDIADGAAILQNVVYPSLLLP
jgi:hypothetical protein